jgi:hypothetical protein
MNPVIAVAPAITFRPEPATRSALTRLANVQELSLGALLDKLITRIDEVTQAKIAGGGGNVAAYLAGDMSADEYRLAFATYQERKAAPVVKLSRVAPAAETTEVGEASSDAAA